eukprot:3838621-Pyramimonas_sp.AAC.1
MLRNRLGSTLEGAQPPEQMGFRPQKGTEGALLILESVISQSIEWNVPVWIVSVDLQKAFDVVEYNALFAALEGQGVDN